MFATERSETYALSSMFATESETYALSSMFTTESDTYALSMSMLHAVDPSSPYSRGWRRCHGRAHTLPHPHRGMLSLTRTE
jgi:hypothetical protein